MEDRIEKQIILKASVSRVWQALTDSRQFGEWFRVKMDGPFRAGEPVGGQLLVPGYEHLHMTIVVKEIQPESYFSYTWHPYAIDPKVDYSQETPTLVEFRLEAAEGGTRLLVTESGFSKLPPERSPDAFRMNSNGWAKQLENIEAYVSKAS